MPKAHVARHAPRKVTPKSNLKLKHSFKTQLVPLRDFLYGIHIRLFSNAPLAQSFCDYVIDGALNQGNGFLKKNRNLGIQALKMLGGEEPDFSGFTLTKNGYPKHYDEIFRSINSIATTVITDFRNRKIYSGCRVYSPDQVHVQRVKALLTLLNWPKMLKLQHSKEQLTELLDSFKRKVTSFKPGDSEYISGLVAERLSKLIPNLPYVVGKEPVFGFNLSDDEKRQVRRNTIDLSMRTYKGRNDKIGTIPRCVAYLQDMAVNPLFIDDSPLGKVTVLSEKAGKTRFITGYTGLVNSTGIYEYLREQLGRLSQDVSSDQSRGHTFVRELTVNTHNSVITSADLSEFTDGLTSSVLYPFLDALGLHDFMAVVNGPIVVGSEVVNPVRPMMGLRGTFEIASLIHHTVCKFANIKDYVLCGDDITFSSGDFEVYVKTWKQLGVEINLTKTVRGENIATFCGKTYWFGQDVSPIQIPYFTLSDLSKADTASATVGDIVSHFVGFSKDISVFLRAHVVKTVGRLKPFRKRSLPKYLPRKLGGFGFPGGPGLISVLERKFFNSISSLPPEKELPDAYVTRRYIPIVSASEVRLFDFTSNLLVRGHYSSKKKLKASTHNLVLKELVDLLEFFYGLGRFSIP